MAQKSFVTLYTNIREKSTRKIQFLVRMVCVQFLQLVQFLTVAKIDPYYYKTLKITKTQPQVESKPGPSFPPFVMQRSWQDHTLVAPQSLYNAPTHLHRKLHFPLQNYAQKHKKIRFLFTFNSSTKFSAEAN
jgi:hypothetical protein